MISIVFHVQFNLVQSLQQLLDKENESLESSLLESIFESIKILCSASSPSSQYFPDFRDGEEQSGEFDPSHKLIEIQQSALLTTLTLKSNVILLKLLLSIKKNN